MFCLRRSLLKRRKKLKGLRSQLINQPGSRLISKSGEMPSLNWNPWLKTLDPTPMWATTVRSSRSSLTRSKTSTPTRANLWKNARKSSLKKWSTPWTLCKSNGRNSSSQMNRTCSYANVQMSSSTSADRIWADSRIISQQNWTEQISSHTWTILTPRSTQNSGNDE